MRSRDPPDRLGVALADGVSVLSGVHIRSPSSIEACKRQGIQRQRTLLLFIFIHVEPSPATL